MVLNEVLQRFTERAPMPVLARLVLDRVLDPKKLNEWFGKTTHRQYTRELLFSSVFEVMSLVAFKAFPTVHAAYQARSGDMAVSVTSLYNKLNGMEATTTRALVRDTAVEFGRDIAGLKGACAPWLPGYRVKVLDGNCIEATEHRLKVLRGTRAGPLPGKSLVVYDPSLEIAIDVFPCEDGHAQERSLLGEVAPTVQEGDVWIMDRNFCVRGFLVDINERKARFICRLHKGLSVTALGAERRVGSTETGTVHEQWVDIAAADGEKAFKCRLIRVKLKRTTRDGDRELLILTDLSKSAANAKLVAEMYRRRWTIETMFQQLEAHLHSEVNTLGYPPAALFAFCIALLAYNALGVTKAALRRVHGEETIATRVSGYYIAIELANSYQGMMIAVPPGSWSRFRRAPQDDYLDLLISIATAVDLRRYRKHTRGPKKPQPKRTMYAGQPHVSTARLLKNKEK